MSAEGLEYLILIGLSEKLLSVIDISGGVQLMKAQKSSKTCNKFWSNVQLRKDKAINLHVMHVAEYVSRMQAL